MNTYNENLQQSVTSTLSAITAEQTKLDSAKTTAEYNLYYAQGAELTARDKLEATTVTSEYYHTVNAQGVTNDSQAINLLASATSANTNVQASVTNVATAASNVQIASNAVALLASDIGAALNIATASLYKTDTYDKILNANSLVNETANDAKAASLTSMETSAATSEIISAEVLTVSTEVKTKIETLLTTTEAQFKSVSEQIVTENATVASTSKTERMAEGTLKDADTGVEAITTTYDNANTELNYGLAVTVADSNDFTVAFDSLPENIFKYPPASGVTIPPKDPKYYLCLVPADKQTLLTTDQAEQLFAQATPGDAPTDNKARPFAGPFSPAVANELTTTTTTSTTAKTTADTNSFTDATKSVDIYGDPIKAGVQYVVFMYAEIAMPYKQFIGNYADIMTTASQTFVLATDLPLAEKNTTKPKTDPDTAAITTIFFQAPGIDIPTDTDQNATLEFRCMFVEHAESPGLNFLTEKTSLTTKLPILFDTDIALQVAPSNYLKAKILLQKQSGSDSDDTKDKAKDKAKGKAKATTTTSAASKTESDDDDIKASCHCPDGEIAQYSVTIPSDATDNFGNPIEDGKVYYPIILTVVDGDSSVSDQFVPQLSDSLDSLTLIPEVETTVTTTITE